MSNTVEDFLQGMGRDLDQGLIPARIFNDEKIHQLELEKIFSRGWVFIGHESEIPNSGDYALRYIGEDSFIFVRSKDQKIRVLFNGCRHRGMSLCRSEKGNCSVFRCPYHGWTYKNTGELFAMPAMTNAYPGLDKSEWGLLEAPQVENLHGLVFACLDETAPPLEHHLGGMKWYLDVHFGVYADQLEIIGEPNRWVVNSNWKMPAENFGADAYHILALHQSVAELGGIPTDPETNMSGYSVKAGKGHTISMNVALNADRDGPNMPFWGLPEDVIANIKPNGLQQEQIDFASKCVISGANVFPNMSYFIGPISYDPKNIPFTTTLMIRQWQPRGPDKTEIWSWVFGWKGASQEFRDLSYRTAMGTLSGPSAIIEQDDILVWEGATKVAKSAFLQQTGKSLNYQMGLGSTNSHSEVVSDWPGPGIAQYPRYDETVQIHLYRQWLDRLLA